MAEVVVTQSAREAAAALYKRVGFAAMAERCRAGEADDDPHVQALAAAEQRGWQAAKEQAVGCQPGTAEDPNESAYERGKFDGVIAFATALSNMEPDHG